MTVATHDTTGGMQTKISEAASIAKLGIDVYIVKVTFLSLLFQLTRLSRDRQFQIYFFMNSGGNNPLG